MADPEDPHPRASFSVAVDPQVSSVPPHPQAFSIPVDPQAVSVPPHPSASTALVDPQTCSDPAHPQAFIVTVDPPHPRGPFLMLSTRAIKDILHGSIVAILFFLNICSYCYMQRREFRSLRAEDEWYRHNMHYYPGYIDRHKRVEIRNYHIAMSVSLTIQIVSLLAIARLYIWASSSRTEKIVSCAFLGILAVFAVDFTLVSGSGGSRTGTMYFVVNIVALSSYCMLCIWRLALSGCGAFVPEALSNCKAYIQYCISKSKLYPIAQPWLQDLPWNSSILLVHGLIIAILLFHTICAKVLSNQIMQIVAYPAIACLHIWASSSRKEMIVSGVFLGALSLTIVFVSLGAHGLDNGTMFTANVVAISWYCIWKLYLLAAKPWLRRYWSAWWAPMEEAWLLLPQQAAATFRIQDLPRRFSSGEIRAMTQGFRTMVGQGGFAQVFRGLLDGAAVAVKRITTAGHAEDDDFLREISIVANVHHRSLVRLLGYCLQRGDGNRYLVYPFLENGSLDSWLFHGAGEGRRRLLPWPTRRCIAVDVAKALAYLHHECHQQILHLDIKPGNILLDGDLRARVSDFGISMSVTPDLSNVDTRGRGTPGYMAPEMMINAVSAKSDVFSYGMTLLELVGGRRNFEPGNDASATPDFRRDFFPYIVREKMARGELMEAVDVAMALVDREEVETVVKVALSCIQSRWDMRPSMLAVVDMLEGRVAIDLPPESRRQLSVNFSDLRSSSPTHDRY